MRFEIKELENSIIRIIPIGTDKDGIDIDWSWDEDAECDFEADLTNSGKLVGNFKDLLDRGHRKIIFDLQTLKYSDSSGLWALDECHKSAEKDGGKVVFTNIHPDIMRLFETVGFQKRLILANSPEKALALF